jgi:hypothetical protein
MILVARVKGSNGRVRELSSAIDINHEYCSMYRKDAIDLGYQEDLNTSLDEITRTKKEAVLVVLSFRGLEIGTLLNLQEVAVGNLVAKNVETVALKMDIPFMTPVDMILGRSFLRNFRLSVDPKNNYFSLV